MNKNIKKKEKKTKDKKHIIMFITKKTDMIITLNV